MHVGQSVNTSFTLKNTGGSVLSITKSKPPQTGGFSATTSLPDGTTMNPGATLTETVRFAPSQPGPATSSWAITGDDDTGPHIVTFNGTGTVPPTADAGPDQPVQVRRTVQLDGTGSTSGDLMPLTYLWQQIGGPSVEPAAGGTGHGRCGRGARKSSGAERAAQRTLGTTGGGCVTPWSGRRPTSTACHDRLER